MGNPQKHKGQKKTTKWNKQLLRGNFEKRHIDQIWEDVRKPPSEVHNSRTGPVGTSSQAILDEQLPGRGKHYCIPCGRYFQTGIALVDHEKTKPHKRRVKSLDTTPRPHNAVDAEMAAGMGPPDHGRRLRSAAAAAAAAVMQQ